MNEIKVKSISDIVFYDAKLDNIMTTECSMTVTEMTFDKEGKLISTESWSENKKVFQLGVVLR